MPASERVDESEARNRLDHLLIRVSRDKERIVIARRSKRVAALVPIEDLERLETLDDAADLASIRSRMSQPAGKPMPLADVAKRLRVNL